MRTSQVIAQKKQGEQLKNAERHVLIAKLVERLCKGYESTYSLAKQLNVSRDTINTYRPLADELIGNMKTDRNVVRNLQIQRVYFMIERFMTDLERIEKSTYDKETKTVNVDKYIALSVQIYAQIQKYYSHLALITGLNVETQVNIDHKQLVIIRANNDKKTKLDPIQVQEAEIPEMPPIEQLTS